MNGSSRTTSGCRYFISVGEPSGDLLAAELADSLRKLLPDWQAFGVCGPEMRRRGIHPVATTDDLAIMGFVEVLRHLPRLRAFESELIAKIERLDPRFVVLVDYPGFHLRLAEQLTLRGIPVFQYVAPQLWAWHAERIELLKRFTRRVLGIMPFEEEFFTSRGVAYDYVGTPQVDRAAVPRDKTILGLGTVGKQTIGFFPGSRVSELEKMLPRLIPIALEARKRGGVDTVFSMAPSLSFATYCEVFARAFGNATRGGTFGGQGGGQCVASFVPDDQASDPGSESFVVANMIRVIRGSSVRLMAACDAAVVTSGTATLECALTGTPLVVAYATSRLSLALARRFVKIPHFSLVNLVAGRKIVSEYVQELPAPLIAAELLELAEANSPTRQRFVADLNLMRKTLRGKPHERAAEILARDL